MREHHAIVLGRAQGEAVAVVAEIQLGLQHFGLLASKVQQCIRTACETNGSLQLLIQYPTDQSEKADQVGLTGAVGSDQHVEPAQLQVTVGDGLVAAQHQSRDLVRVVDLLDHANAFSLRACLVIAAPTPR